MPPKRSDLIHVAFHFHKSAVFLSVPSSTTLSALKSKLLPALKPLETIIPSPFPQSESDYQLYDDKEAIEGAEPTEGELKSLEDGDLRNKTLLSLKWPMWKKVYVSFKNADGEFGKPEYTIPDADDGDADQEGGDEVAAQ